MKIHQLVRNTSDFQKPVNELELGLQLNRQLSGESILEVKELKAGFFNNTYVVNTSQKAYILKVAPESNAEIFYNEHYLMQREQSLSHHLQTISPLIPEYLSFFTIADRNAFLQPMVKGRLWHDAYSVLSEETNTKLWKQLGAFARLLHNTRGERFGYPGPCKSFTRWSQFIIDNVQGLVADCCRLNVLCKEIETFHRYLPQFLEKLDQVKTANLLHGDLWPRNVIIDGSASDIRIKAIIDCERAYWGDPVSDWVLILYGVPNAFWQGYGENLLRTRDPVCISIYKGMYFILNILEGVRFRNSNEEPRKRLSKINKDLKIHLYK